MRTLYEWFSDSADAYPDTIAIEVKDVSMTYRQLRAAAEWMSARIVEAAGGRPRTVGLLTSRDIVSYVGYLAVQRLGAIGVPLNPAAPAVRNADITLEASIDLTLIDNTSGEGLTEYREKSGVRVLDMTGDNWRGLFDPDPTAEIPEQGKPGPKDLAYITFTSGTTGKPKGVPTMHLSVDAFLSDILTRFALGPKSRVSQTFEMFFDGVVIESWGAWGAGGTLCVCQHADIFTPVKFINEKRLTHWMSVPSAISFARRLRALQPGCMPTLERGMFGGDAMNIEQAEAWAAAAPKAVLNNCYGPTETTIIMTGYLVPSNRADWVETSNRSVPIGYPYPHLEWVLIDDDLRVSDDGELCVRGPQRFPGYLDPAENFGRFVLVESGRGSIYDGDGPVTDAHYYRTGDRCRIEHGEMVHLGRMDGMVKVRGNRLELGEIESALRRHPAIEDAVVVTVPDGEGEIDLHAVYTGGEVTIAEFNQLLTRLPGYMHPRKFHRRDTIPLTGLNKVDRRGLSAQLARELGTAEAAAS